MNRFIPREKLGKKARKALDAQRRASWSFSPTIRKVESKKRYNRKTHEREECGIVGFDLCYQSESDLNPFFKMNPPDSFSTNRPLYHY